MSDVSVVTCAENDIINNLDIKQHENVIISTIGREKLIIRGLMMN